MRFLCSLTAGEHELRAVCSNIGVSGLYLRLSEEARHLGEVATGKKVSIAFRLPIDRGLIMSEATIMWVDPDDRDPAGRPSVGLGLRLDESNREALTRIDAFIENFQYAVLAVDPSLEALETMRRALAEDYRVVTARSALEAVEVLESTEVAVVIAEESVRMVNGLSLSEHLGQRATDSSALQIAVCAASSSRRLRELVGLGHIFHVLRRPYEEDDLLLMVRRAVDAYSLGAENERLSEELERANQRLVRENRSLRQRLGELESFASVLDKTPVVTASGQHRIQVGHTAIVVPGRMSYDATMELVQRKLIERALAEAGGLVSRAAELLGMERSRLVKLRQRLGVS